MVLCRRAARAIGALCLLALLLASSGCGYALAGRGSFLPAHIRTIAIPPIENRTAFVRIEERITGKIMEEFIGRGKYHAISDTDGADAILRGVITSIQTQTAGLNAQQLGSRYLFIVVMNVTFTDARTNDVLWSNDSLTFREEYEIGSQASIQGASFVDQYGPAVERLAADVARTVVTAIMEAF